MVSTNGGSRIDACDRFSIVTGSGPLRSRKMMMSSVTSLSFAVLSEFQILG
jgi:hypothetical protein